MAYPTPEQNREYQKRYRTENREAYLAYRKAYYKANQNREIQRQLKYYYAKKLSIQ